MVIEARKFRSIGDEAGKDFGGATEEGFQLGGNESRKRVLTGGTLL
jgi:hypothetical protein